MGKGADMQDIRPSFNYKCSWQWHSCNWGADLCQIISPNVGGWSPRRRGGHRRRQLPTSLDLGQHMSAAFLRSIQGLLGQATIGRSFCLPPLHVTSLLRASVLLIQQMWLTSAGDGLWRGGLNESYLESLYPGTGYTASTQCCWLIENE